MPYTQSINFISLNPSPMIIQGRTIVPVGPLFEGTGAQSLWDTVSRSPYFTYYKDGIRHEVWYENAESLSHKLDIVNEFDIGGIAIWKLGYDNNAFWQVINDKLD